MRSSTRVYVLLSFLLFSALQGLGQCKWSNVGAANLERFGSIFKDPFTGKIYCSGEDKVTKANGIFERVDDQWVFKCPSQGGSGEYTISADGTFYRVWYFIQDIYIKARVEVYKNDTWQTIYTSGGIYYREPDRPRFTWGPTSNPNVLYLAIQLDFKMYVGKIESNVYKDIYVENCDYCEFGVAPSTGIPYVTTDARSFRTRGAVYRYTGSEWLQVGQTTDVSNPTGIDLAFGRNGEVFSAFTSASSGRLLVRKLVDDAWETAVVIANPNPNRYIKLNDLQANNQGHPVIAYCESDLKAPMRVVSYANGWGANSIVTDSGMWTEREKLLIDKDGDYYITYDSLKYDPRANFYHSYGGYRIKTLSTFSVSPNTEPTRPVCLGGKETFTVQAQGKQLNYQWRVKQGNSYQPLPESGTYVGVHTNSLTITSLTSAHNGVKLQCVVSNGGCVDTTWSVTLKTGSPIGVHLPKDTLPCTIDKAVIPVKAIWYRWDNLAENTPLETLLGDDADHTLTFQDLNGCLGATTVRVKPRLLPQLTISAATELFCEGVPVAFTAQTDAVSVQWHTKATTRTINYPPTRDTLLSVRAVAQNGCVDTAYFPIVVKKLLHVTLDGTKDASCLTKNHLFLDKNYDTDIRWFKDNKLVKEQSAYSSQTIDSLMHMDDREGGFFGLPDEHAMVVVRTPTSIQKYNFNTQVSTDLFVKHVEENNPTNYRITNITYLGNNKFVFLSNDAVEGKTLHEYDLATRTHKVLWDKFEGEFSIATTKPAIFYELRYDDIVEHNWSTKTSKVLCTWPGASYWSYHKEEQALYYTWDSLYRISLAGDNFTPVVVSSYLDDLKEQCQITENYIMAPYTHNNKLLILGRHKQDGGLLFFFYNVITHKVSIAMQEGDGPHTDKPWESNLYADNRVHWHIQAEGYYRTDYNDEAPALDITEPGTYYVETVGQCPEKSNKLFVYDECTGLESEQASRGMSIYPNPTSGYVQLHDAANVSKIEVTNSLGKMVYSQQVHNDQTQFDLSFLTEGQYVLKLHLEGQGIRTQKLTVLK